jgi:hypothetical protein
MLALKAGWKFKKYFSTRSEARSWLAAGTDPSDSNPSSSSDSEKNNSSSSSSSGPHCHHSKHSSKSRKNHKKRPSYRETDPSTGNDKQIHEFEITDTKIDKLAPDNLTTKERASIVEAVVDATALPGMFSSSSDTMYNEVQGVTEAATSMLATILGKRDQLHDTQWKTMRKNPLGLTKKETDLFELIKAVDDSSVPAFDQQDSKIRSFMYRCHYTTPTRSSTTLNTASSPPLLDALTSIFGTSEQDPTAFLHPPLVGRRAS